MRCSKCGSKLHVKDTVHNLADNEVYRKRICDKCGFVIFTTEFEVEADMDYLELWYSNHRHRKPRKKNQIPGQITLDTF